MLSCCLVKKQSGVHSCPEVIWLMRKQRKAHGKLTRKLVNQLPRHQNSTHVKQHSSRKFIELKRVGQLSNAKRDETRTLFCLKPSHFFALQCTADFGPMWHFAALSKIPLQKVHACHNVQLLHSTVRKNHPSHHNPNRPLRSLNLGNGTAF